MKYLIGIPAVIVGALLWAVFQVMAALGLLDCGGSDD